MSRSYKKNPIIKDKGLKRKDYNSVFRRINKQRINQGKEPFHYTNEVVNGWDVCDWRFHAEEFEINPFGYIQTREEQQQIIEQFKRK